MRGVEDGRELSIRTGRNFGVDMDEVVPAHARAPRSPRRDHYYIGIRNGLVVVGDAPNLRIKPQEGRTFGRYPGAFSATARRFLDINEDDFVAEVGPGNDIGGGSPDIAGTNDTDFRHGGKGTAFQERGKVSWILMGEPSLRSPLAGSGAKSTAGQSYALSRSNPSLATHRSVSDLWHSASRRDWGESCLYRLHQGLAGADHEKALLIMQVGDLPYLFPGGVVNANLRPYVSPVGVPENSHISFFLAERVEFFLGEIAFVAK